MIPYLFIFFLILSLVYIDVHSERFTNVERRTAFLVVTATIALFVGFRDMIGGYDVYVYGEVFDVLPALTGLRPFLESVRINNANLPQILEPGFLVLNGIVKIFTDNRYIYFLILSILSYGCIFLSFRKYMPFLFFAIFIFSCKFLLMSFVYVRQMLAMSIVWLSIPFILKRDLLKFCALMLLAYLIHNSSLIFFPIYFIGLKKINPLLINLALLTFLIIGASSLFTDILGEVGETMNIQKALIYASKQLGGINYFYALEASGLAFLLYRNREFFYREKASTLFYNISLAYVGVTLFTLRDATGVRFVWYFMIGMIYVVSMLPYVYSWRPQLKAFLFVGILCYFTALHFRLLLIWDGGDMIPYQTFLSDEKRPSVWSGREYTTKYEKNRSW